MFLVIKLPIIVTHGPELLIRLPKSNVSRSH